MKALPDGPVRIMIENRKDSKFPEKLDSSESRPESSTRQRPAVPQPGVLDPAPRHRDLGRGGDGVAGVGRGTGVPSSSPATPVRGPASGPDYGRGWRASQTGGPWGWGDRSSTGPWAALSVDPGPIARGTVQVHSQRATMRTIRQDVLSLRTLGHGGTAGA